MAALLIFESFSSYPISLFINILLAVSFSHNCLDQRKFFHWAGSSNRGTEKERQREGAVGRLGRHPLLFFLCLPLTLSALGSFLERPVSSEWPDNNTYQKGLITGRLSRKKSSPFLPFFQHLLVASNSNLRCKAALFSDAKHCFPERLEQGAVRKPRTAHILSNSSWS